MVLADRTAENVRNGRRSRGPSPNGHSAVLVAGGITESSSDDENSRKNGTSSKAAKTKSEYEEKIRVGRDYQAVCPELIPLPERKPEQLNDRALLVWSPTKEIPDNKLEEYITVAKEKYGYNGEQALGMLFWHKHDLERAVLDLANFTPFPDEWTVEDKVLFEQAFQFHGKSFHRIRQMLPDKSIASLVKFYYSWKKTRSRTSVMDRQEKLKKNDSSENGSDQGSNEDSDNEDKPTVATTGTNPTPNVPSTGTCPAPVSNSSTSIPNANGPTQNELTETKQSTVEMDGGVADSVSGAGTNGSNNSSATASLNCTGCGVMCSELNATPQGKLCGSCYHHWRRTGVLRPTSGPTFMHKRARNSNLLGKSGDSHKRRPPRGMYINHDDIVKLANSAQNHGSEMNPNDDLLAAMDREIVSLWSQIQLNKQCVSKLKHEIEQYSELHNPTDALSARVNSRWNNEELLLAVQGVRKYGRDFQAIADTIGTKTEAQLRTFYHNYRRRYNLDNVLKEYEAEQKQLQEQMNNNNNPSGTNNNKDENTVITACETECTDSNSLSGDKVEMDVNKKVSGKKGAAVSTITSDTDIMEIDLVDDELVNGKKLETEDAVDSSGNLGSGSGGTHNSSIQTGSTKHASGSPGSSAIDGVAMEVDEQSSSSVKLSDTANNSTIIIK